MSTPARVRRSKRLASEEPSPPAETAHAPPKRVQAKRAATAFDPFSTITSILRGNRAIISQLTNGNLQALVRAFADRAQMANERIESLENDLHRAQSQRSTGTMRRSQYNMKMSEIMQKHGEKHKVEAATQTADPPPPASTQTATSPWPVTPTDAIANTPTAAPPSSMWKSFTSYLNPFSRKRAAEDEPASSAPPSQKRQKPTEAASSSIEPSTIKSTSAAPSEPAAIEQSGASPPPAVNHQPRGSPSPAPAQRPTTTPTPKRKRTIAHSTTATPLPAITETSPKAPLTSVMGVTPRPRRTLASTRKAPQTHQPQRRYAWEPVPKVKMSNADERYARVKRAEQLRKELAQLEQQDDLARKIKRVKVDHLTEIPHNRPGDSSSTFRVPDIDSDDEMEVFDDVEVRSNIFSTPQPPKEHTTTAPLQTQLAEKPREIVQQVPVQQTPIPAPPKQASKPAPAPAPSVFAFPSVGSRPAGYQVTPAYQKACGALFMEGLAAFEAAR